MNTSEKHLNTPTCWVITEGMAGTENQCLGVAEALGITPEVKKIHLRQPWKTLSPYIGFEQSYSFYPSLTPPWPDLLLTSGRKSIAAARYIKKQSGGKTFTAHIQDPRISPSAFDLVAVPAHDRLRGKNVIVTTAAPNRITPNILAAAQARFSFLESVSGPRVAVLIGGNSRAHRLTDSIVNDMIDRLNRLDAGLMVTASRRTGAAHTQKLKSALKHSFFWDGTGENPYQGMLAWADFIVVTSDSVSMISDAATTGKPVYMIPLEGGGTRLDLFHKNLADRKITRIFDGGLTHWNYAPLRDSEMIAAAIHEKIVKRNRI